MNAIKTMSSIEDVILVSAELKDMAFESPKDLVTMQHLDRLGFELLAQLLNSRKVTQKEYWAAYLGWFDLWNHDLPCWGNDADCDFEWEDELYEEYNPQPKTLNDLF